MCDNACSYVSAVHCPKFTGGHDDREKYLSKLGNFSLSVRTNPLELGLVRGKQQKFMNNKIKSALAAASMLALYSGALNAQLITFTAGNFTINADGYSSSTISADPSASAKGGLTVGPAGQKEDTWGIFQITSIKEGSGPSQVTRFQEDGTSAPSQGFQYYGFFYGSYDTSATPFGAGNINFLGNGLKLDIYKVDVADISDSYFNTVVAQGTAGRIDLDSFRGITEAIGPGPGPVFTQVLSSSIIGSLDSTFYGSSFTTFAGGNLQVTSNSLFSGPGATSALTFGLGGFTDTPSLDRVPADWTVSFGGDITGNFTVVPEPSTYALFGVVGLLGLVAVKRFRSSKKAS